MPEEAEGDEATEAPRDAETAETVIPFSPFRRPGTHELSIRLDGGGADPAVAERPTPAAEPRRLHFTVGFIDYVWGRDNFDFANDAEYRKSLDSYSVMLTQWLEERFEGVSEAEKALLVHEMYTLFGKNAGRCYAFAGSQLRYYRRPELLPRYYDTLYEVSERNRVLRKEMTFLQMDVVFHHFVEGTQQRHPESPHTQAELIALSRQIRNEIDAGSPVVLGLLAAELHHAVMVYGYIADPQRRTVDLIAANNWKRDQEVNLYSPDVENLRLYLGDEHDGRRIEWRNAKKRRTREPDRIFIADIRREYEHERAALDRLIQARLADVQERGIALLVVEQADSAYLRSPSGNITGYDKPRTTRGIDGVEYRRVQTTYQFTVPADSRLELHVEHTGQARIFSVGPPGDGGRSPDDAGQPASAVIHLGDSGESGTWQARIRNGAVEPQ
jgi:hypothetical protein